MLMKSWIRNLWKSLASQSQAVRSRRGSQRQRACQAIETLEVRTLLTVPPVVSSINLAGGTDTNASTTSWTVGFSKPVTGVDPTDFQLIETGTVGATLTQIFPVGVAGTDYTVTVSGITGNGTLGLNLIDDNSIMDLSSNSLGGPSTHDGDFTGQVETIDTVAPFVQSIDRATPVADTTNAGTIIYTATFREDVTGVDPTDFAVVTTGTVAVSPTQVTMISASVYTVTVSGITGNGTLGLNLIDDGSIHDAAGNLLVQFDHPVTLAMPTTLASDAYSYSLTVADVNGDGKPDLVSVDYYLNAVNVVLGNGDGTFQDTQTFATGRAPYSQAVGDINGDGKPDIVVANKNDASVSLLLGNGDGTFQPAQDFTAGADPNSVTLGDLNGDGKLDMIVANEGEADLSVLLGNGDGSFQAQQTFATGPDATSLTLADLNGDGKPDIVAADLSLGTHHGSVTVLMGNGDGTFQPRSLIQSGIYPFSVAVGDLNGDGKPDLAVANTGSGTVSVMQGNGDGTFGSPRNIRTGGFPQSVTIGDLNGDGTPDLIVTNGRDGTVSVLVGNGDGTFQSQQTFEADYRSISVVVSDLNGDGRPDLAYSADHPGAIFGNGNGDFTGPVETIDTIAPSVLSLDRTTPASATTAASSVTLTATFSEPVTGVDVSDFSLLPTGTVSWTSTQLTAVSTSVYTITFNGISGFGTLGVNLVDDGSITDLAGNELVLVNGNGDFIGQKYSIVQLPSVTTPTSVGITTTSAMLGGNVISDGGSALSGVGIVYSVTSTNSNPQLDGTGVTNLVFGTTALGALTLNATGLTPGVSYSFAAYATNGAGTTYTSPVSTFSTLINHAPSGTTKTTSTLENKPYVFTAADFGFSDTNDTPANMLLAVKFSLLPTAGTLQDNGIALTVNQFVSATDINAGKLAFTPNANLYGGPFFAGKYQVEDDGGTVNAGVDLDPVAKILYVNLAKVNQTPVGTSSSITVGQNTPYVIKTSDFGYTDPNDTPANALLAVKVTSLPTAGTLTNNGVAVSVNQFVSASDISTGKLIFTPNHNVTGGPSVLGNFQVQDNGGTANGGVNLDPTAKSLNVNIVAVNRAPTGTTGTVATALNVPYLFTATDFGFSDASDSPANSLLAVKFTLLPTAGTLADNGVALTANQFVSATDIAGGKLVFIPNNNLLGGPFFVAKFQVQDNGGTANGGVDLDTTQRILYVNIVKLNHAPTGTTGTVTGAKTAAYVMKTADFGFSDTGDTPSNALLGVKFTLLPGAGSLTDNGVAITVNQVVSASDITGGKLIFTPINGLSANTYFLSKFQVEDNGGTVGGGVDLDPTAKILYIKLT